LAQDYADQPVVFIEYDVDDAPSDRVSRWWAAFTGGSVTLPMVMADSGNQISYGPVNYRNVYKGMVDTALARPAQAEILANWWRTGNKAGFYIQVKNLSGVTLSSSNFARVYAIVYEDAHVNVTNRFGRSVVAASITNLANNASATFKLETPELSGVNWANLHYIVLVDYLPSGSTGAYDMLQAVIATPISAPFSAQPDTMTFVVDSADTTNPFSTVIFQGSSFANWTAAPGPTWLNLTPPNGPITAPMTLSTVKSNLATGWQQGIISFSTADGLFTDQMTVNAYYGAVEKIYLPTVLR